MARTSPQLTALAAFGVVISLVSLPGSVVLAAPAEEEALIKHGLELREAHDDVAARAEFQRAFQLSHGARPLAQMALAEQALGRWVEAETHLTEALRSTDDSWIGRNRDLLRQSLTTIQGHTGSLEITGAVAGADIFINNEKVGTSPLPAVLVPAGSVALEIRAPGYLPVVRTVMISARSLAREHVVLVAAPVDPLDVSERRQPPAIATAKMLAPVAPPPASTALAGHPDAAVPDAGWSSRKKVGVGIAAGGVASLIVGIAFQAVREQRAGAFNDHQCGVTGDLVTGPSDCRSRHDDITGAERVAIAGFVGAAVLGGVGAFLSLSGGGKSSATTSVAGGVRCLPSSGSGVGAVCAARF